jgi:S1-C subfamily serine protease
MRTPRSEEQVASARSALQAKEEQRGAGGRQPEQEPQQEEWEHGSELVVDRGRGIGVTRAHVVAQAAGEDRGRLLRVWRGASRRGEDSRAALGRLVDGWSGTTFARVWVIEG